MCLHVLFTFGIYIHPIFNEKIENVLAKEDLEELLPQTISVCIENNLITRYSQRRLSPEQETCNRVRYVEILLKKIASIRSTLKNYNSTYENNIRDVYRINDMNYETAFIEYSQEGKPFIADTDLVTFGETLSFERLVEECFPPHNKGRLELLTLQSDGCLNEIKMFRFPEIMVNDYLQRTGVTDVLRKLTFRLYREGHDRISSCEYGAHMILVPITNDHVEVKIFHKNDSFAFFRFNSDGGVLQDYPSSMQSYAFEGLNPFVYNSKDYPLISTLTSYEGSLKKGNLLFVPGSLLAAWKSDDLHGPSNLLSFCYVDASNFNNVKEELRKEALINEFARDVLLELHSPIFDTTMIRKPHDEHRIWDQFRTWPRSEVFVPHPRSRKERYKAWQEDTNWKWRIQTLSLPSSLPPIISAIKRQGVDLTWQDVYAHRAEDTTEYGYVITWINTENVSHTPEFVRLEYTKLIRSERPTEMFGKDYDGFSLTHGLQGLHPNTSYYFTVAVYVGDVVGPKSSRSLTIKTLPMTPPSVVPGIPRAIVAHYDSAHLEWELPVDDGGSPILYYIVARKHFALSHVTGLQDNSEDGFDYVVAVGKGRKATLVNLLPGSAYRFRVAGVNAVGVGIQSMPSAVLHIKQQSKHTELMHISGVGHTHFARISYDGTVDDDGSFDHERFRMNSFEPSSNIIATLSDRHQEIRVYRDRNELLLVAPLWSSHYSPRTFNVSAEIVFASPRDGATTFDNADEVRDRLVFVERGRVAFRTKAVHAQQAGALGVIIIESGYCHGIFDQNCCPGSDKSRGEGFAALDEHAMWKDITIPTVMMLKEDGDKISNILFPAANEELL